MMESRRAGDFRQKASVQGKWAEPLRRTTRKLSRWVELLWRKAQRLRTETLWPDALVVPLKKVAWGPEVNKLMIHQVYRLQG